MRDYETVKVEQEVPNEFLLVLDDGEVQEGIDAVIDGSEPETKRRRKGAYYKNIERKMILKKKRVNVGCLVLLVSLVKVFNDLAGS